MSTLTLYDHIDEFLVLLQNFAPMYSAPFRVMTSDPLLTTPTRDEIVKWDRTGDSKGDQWFVSGKNGAGTYVFVRIAKFLDS